jgi:hypothetical protein
MNMPAMGNFTGMQVQRKVVDLKVVPLIQPKYKPPGRLLACQLVRASQRLDSGAIQLTDAMSGRLEQAGIKHTTTVMRVVAIGDEVKWYQPDDLILVPVECTTFMVNYGGDDTVLIHEEGTFGKVLPAFEYDLRKLMK